MKKIFKYFLTKLTVKMTLNLTYFSIHLLQIKNFKIDNINNLKYNNNNKIKYLNLIQKKKFMDIMIIVMIKLKE